MFPVSDPLLTQNRIGAGRSGRKQRKIRRANGGKKHKSEPKQLRFVRETTYNTSTKTVTATRTYPNLSDADISFVPKSITDNGRTMELADVQWQESDGFYHASATYTGKVSSKYATGYIVTADYSGEVVRTTMDDTIYTAIFSGTPIQPERSAFDWRYLLILPAGAGVAGLVVLGRNWLKKRKNEKKWEEYTK